MGMLYYHYPLITNRTINDNLARKCIKYFFLAYIGLFYTFMAAGAAGMPRRNGAWESDWFIWGALMLVFGAGLIYAFYLYFMSLTKSKALAF